MTGERKNKPRGFLLFSLSYMSPPPHNIHTQTDTYFSNLKEKVLFFNLLGSFPVYTSVSWVAFAPGPGDPGRKEINPPPPPHTHTPPGLLLLWVLFFFFNLPATTDFQSSAACILSRVFSYIQWEGWGRVCLLPNLNQNPVNYLLTLYFMVPVWW